MIYAMSDIHGEYEKYRAMLKLIRFSQEDTLYVLGDAVDRGPHPIKLLQDMASRDNVFLIKGNHEAIASYILHKLNVEICESNAESHIDIPLMQAILDWQHEGDDTTMKEFCALSCEEKNDLLDYIDDAPLCDVVDAGENTFILVHSGLGNFDPKKPLYDYSFDELACMRADYERRLYRNPSVYIVSGHTPTLAITGKPEIYRAHGHIAIDCGAAFAGRLACICLDTMEEYYV